MINFDRYIVNVEGAILQDNRYLMIIRGAEEAHAAGTLSFVGGKVEEFDPAIDILESAFCREVAEEIGIAVKNVSYVHSSLFVTDSGDPCIDIVFLSQYESGEPTISDPGEVAEICWLTFEEIMNHPKAPVWTLHSIARAESVRIKLGWS